MTDNKDYWKELFGEEGILGADVGITGQSDTMDFAAEGGAPFGVDENFSKLEEEFRHAASEQSVSDGDTSVIPPDVYDLSAFTQAADANPYAEEDETDANFHTEDDDDPIDAEGEDLDVRDERAVRFARRRRTGCMGGVMYAAFVVGLGVLLACLAWLAVDDMLALTKPEFTVEIAVPEDFTIEGIAEQLRDEGIISYPFLFTWFAGVFNAEERIQPGIYQVSAVDFRAIISSMNQRTGVMIEVNVLIPEGRTKAETFQILEDNGVATVEALQYAAMNSAFNFSFLQDLQRGHDNWLEGYLFPDTYTFFKQQNPETVINRMLSNFNTRMEQNGVFELLEESEMTLHEAVNIAAMIEREVANSEEMPIVSSVIHNRLAIDMLLQIDATVLYALGEHQELVTEAMTQVDSPYNTYLHPGLPRGPIANPGVATILAAIQPADTNYLFYALHVDGTHRFFPNFDQHSAFVSSENFFYFEQWRAQS